MKKSNLNSQNVFVINGHNEGTNKLEQLKQYIRQSPYIEPLEQPKICKSFGVPFKISLFRKEYTRRFYEYLKNNTTTVCKVSQDTKIHRAYLCQVKRLLEKKGLLKVVKLDRCPVMGSPNVQFVSTNEEILKSLKDITISNQ